MKADKHFRMFSASQLQDNSFPVRVLGASDGDTHAAIPFVLPVAVANASGDTDVVMDRKCRLLHVDVLKVGGNGGAGDELTVGNGSSAITDAISLNINAKVATKNAQIDPAHATLAAGDILRFSATSATNCACQVDAYLLPVE